MLFIVVAVREVGLSVSIFWLCEFAFSLPFVKGNIRLPALAVMCCLSIETTMLQFSPEQVRALHYEYTIIKLMEEIDISYNMVQQTKVQHT